LHEGFAGPGDARVIVAAEVGDGLEIGRQAAQQPDQLQAFFLLVDLSAIDSNVNTKLQRRNIDLHPFQMYFVQSTNQTSVETPVRGP
jgi:hypothetical protein